MSFLEHNRLVSRHYTSQLSRNRITMLLVLPLLLVLFGCQTRFREGGQALAKAGSKTAGTLSDYYNGLITNVDNQADLEIFYRKIQTPALPDFLDSQRVILENQATALRHRAQMASDLASVYDALSKLSSYQPSTDLNKSVDNLTTSLQQISSEPPKILGSNAGDILKPVIDGLVDWQQSRDIRKAVQSITPWLENIKQVVHDETTTYNIIVDRHYVLLMGENVSDPDTHVTSTTTGIADYLLQKQSMNLPYLLQELPELQGFPWNQAPVQDQNIKDAMKLSLDQDLKTLASKSKSVPTQIEQSLDGLIKQHQALLKKQPLDFKTIFQDLEQAQTYIDLLAKLEGQKAKK